MTPRPESRITAMTFVKVVSVELLAFAATACSKSAKDFSGS